MATIRYIPENKLVTEVIAAVQSARKEILATENLEQASLPPGYAEILSAQLASGKVVCRRVAFSDRQPSSEQVQMLAGFPGTSRILAGNFPRQRLILIDGKRLFWSNDNPLIPIACETRDKKFIQEVTRYFEKAWKSARLYNI